MANRSKGEVSVTFRGQAINLAMTFNVICAIEDAFDQPIEDAMARFDDQGGQKKLSMRDMRVLFHQLLIYGMPDASQEDAGDLIEEIGMQAAGKLLEQIMARSMIASEGNKARPPA